MKERRGMQGGVTRILGIGAAAGALLGAPAFAVAQTDGAAQSPQAMQQPVRASEVGHSTRAWFDLQSSNSEAAPALPMLGAEAGLAYRRYMESFKSKIPDLYGSTLNGNASGGGSGGGNTMMGGSGGAGAN